MDNVEKCDKTFLILVIILLILSLFSISTLAFQFGEMWGWAQGTQQTLTTCMLQNMTNN